MMCLRVRKQRCSSFRRSPLQQPKSKLKNGFHTSVDCRAPLRVVGVAATELWCEGSVSALTDWVTGQCLAKAPRCMSRPLVTWHRAEAKNCIKKLKKSGSDV